MQFTVRRAGLVIAGVIAAQGSSVCAQESLRNSLEYDRIANQRQQRFTDGHYNLKLGPVLVNTSVSTSISYNDNINVSEGASQDDVIFTPSASLGLLWQVTEYNRLALDVSVGYAAYINHPEYNRPNISPGSSSDISYDFSVGAFKFNLHDRFFYAQDPLGYGSGAVAGQADLGRFRNAVGINSQWRMRDDTSISFGYDHSDRIFLNDLFQNTDSSSETVFARVTHVWNPTLQVGLEVSGGITDYKQQFRPDNRNYTIGPHLKWRLTSTIDATARVGVSGYELTNLGALGDLSSPLSFYGSLEITHRINQRVTQSLDIGQDTSEGIGISANFMETLHVRHSATWRVINNVSVTTELFYDYTKDTSQGFGTFLAESFSRFGGSISFGYQIMERLTSSLTYLRTEKQSSLAGFNFSQNSVTLSLSYHF